MRRTLLLMPLGAYIIITLILSHPLLLNLSRAVPSDIGDPLLNSWILAWDSHALLTAPLSLFQANIFYPLPNTLAYSEHLFSTALLILPLQLATAEPVVAYNMALLLTFPLAGWSMYLLTLHWTHHRPAAFLAGLIFAFGPYRFAAIAHLQLLTFHWLPLVLLFVDYTLRRPRRRHTLALSLLLTMQLLASWYLAVYSGLIIALYLLIRCPWRRMGRLLPPFLLTMLLVMPLAWPYISMLRALRQARPLSLALSLAAQPTDYLAAAPFNQIFGPLTAPWRDRPGFTEENMLFLGLLPWGLMLCAALRYRRQPRLLMALLSILLLTLSLTLAPPYAMLATLLPPSTVVRVPARWVIPATFALSGLAALGYLQLRRLIGHERWLFAACISLLLLESYAVPLPMAAVANRQSLNPAYHWLANQPDSEFALLELPLHSAPAPEYPEVKRLYASTLGWWQLVNGYSGYTPPRQSRLAQAMAPFPAAEAVRYVQQFAGELPLPLYLLVHPGEAPMERAGWEDRLRWQAARNPGLWPVGQFAGDYLYRVQPYQPERFVRAMATFGGQIQLLDYQLTGERLLLYWQATGPIQQNYTVFVHLRAADGFVRAQADGPPVSGHYPTMQWLPGEVVQDVHPLPMVEFDHVAVGLYQPDRGARLPAVDGAGRPLAEGVFVIRFPKGRVGD